MRDRTLCFCCSFSFQSYSCSEGYSSSVLPMVSFSFQLHMKRIFIIISVVFVLAGIASGTEFTQRFNAKEGFTLKLPHNWVRIPGEILDEHSRKLQLAAPDAEKSAYDYGFQLSGAEHWFACPYILIWLNKTGRIPEGKMKKLTQEQ